jgi:hypothetical protein
MRCQSAGHTFSKREGELSIKERLYELIDPSIPVHARDISQITVHNFLHNTNIFATAAVSAIQPQDTEKQCAKRFK